MNSIERIRVNTDEQRQLSRALRQAVLREPWGQALEPDREVPADDLLLVHGGEAIATARLFINAGGREARIRGMAVREDHRGRGFGGQLRDLLLAYARGRGCEYILAHARTGALAFYTAAGFDDIGEGPLLFGQIPHRVVRRRIVHSDFSPWRLRLEAARRDDRESLEGLIFPVLAEYGLGTESDGIDRDLEDIPAFYAGGGFWLVRDHNDHCMASVALLALGDGAVELRRMYMRPEQRGQGLGRALLGFALWQARELGFSRMELETATVLAEARALYQWAGFEAASGPLEARRCDMRMARRIAWSSSENAPDNSNPAGVSHRP